MFLVHFGHIWCTGGRDMPKMGVLGVVLHLNMSLRDGKMERNYNQTGKDVQKT